MIYFCIVEQFTFFFLATLKLIVQCREMGLIGTQADTLKYYLLKWILKGYYDKEDTGILQSCKENYVL